MNLKMNHNFINLTGQKFGRLMIKELAFVKRGRSYWLCKCICGKEIIVPGNHIKSGNTKSCGCLHDEGNNLRHGYGRKGKVSKTRSIWLCIIQRCTNKNYKQYRDYGDRGISVCYRWSDINPRGYENFVHDIGNIPRGMSIDRIDNNGNYSPWNWRFATMRTQSRNKRNNIYKTLNGKKQLLIDLAKEYKINCVTLKDRLGRGMSIEEALTVPVRKYNKKKNKGI